MRWWLGEADDWVCDFQSSKSSFLDSGNSLEDRPSVFQYVCINMYVYISITNEIQAKSIQIVVVFTIDFVLATRIGLRGLSTLQKVGA